MKAERIQLNKQESTFHLTATTQGEPLDRDHHHQRVDVRAVTLDQFKLESTQAGWMAQVILDI